MLLDFTMVNHRSFREEASLSLVSPSLRTKFPADGRWEAHLERVAAIYGANASGKTAVLDGLRHMLLIVSRSMGSNPSRTGIPYRPFALDSAAKTSPSKYSVTFIGDDGELYEYGFSITRERVASEYLDLYRTSKATNLFDRINNSIEWGRALKGPKQLLERVITPQDLILGKAISVQHPALRNIGMSLLKGVTFADFGDTERRARISEFVEKIAAGTLSRDEVLALLTIADVGIAGLDVKERQVPEPVRRILEHLTAGDGDGQPQEFNPMDGIDPQALISQLGRALEFEHLGLDGKLYSLALEAESSGTLAWLTLSIPAIEILRDGGVYCVDEIDANLHPYVSQVLVSMFADPEANPLGAQLLFTTHDTFFIDRSNPDRLPATCVWFAEKNEYGESSLFSLSDFPNRADQNFALRYLSGRYGAIPAVARSEVYRLVNPTQETLPFGSENA